MIIYDKLFTTFDWDWFLAAARRPEYKATPERGMGGMQGWGAQRGEKKQKQQQAANLFHGWLCHNHLGGETKTYLNNAFPEVLQNGSRGGEKMERRKRTSGPSCISCWGVLASASHRLLDSFHTFTRDRKDSSEEELWAGQSARNW